MNYSALLKNSGRLIWRHKLLMVFGLLLVSSAIPGIITSHAYSRFWLSTFPTFTAGADPDQVFQPIADFFINPDLTLVFGGTIGIFFGFILIWLLTTLGEISLIRGVADFDDGQPRSLGQLLATGTRLLIRIIAIDTVIFLPLFLILLIQLLTIGGGLIGGTQFLTRPGSTLDDLVPIVLIVGLILLFLSILAVPVLILTMMLRLLAFRSAILEDLPTRPSIRRAWGLVRAHLGQIVIIAVLLYAVSYIFGMITSILVMPLSFGGMFMMFRSFTPGQLPQLSNFDGFLTLITLASLVGILPNLVYRVFSSAVWTLAYREWQKAS